MIDRTLRLYLQCSLVVHYIPLKSLFTFLIALGPHGRRCPRLVKAKILRNLHHQFSCAHLRNASYPRRIFLEALQNIPISAISIDLQLPVSRLQNSQFWDLEHVFRYYHIFGKNCLPSSLQLLWDVHISFPTKALWSCYLPLLLEEILLRSLSSNVQRHWFLVL